MEVAGEILLQRLVDTTGWLGLLLVVGLAIAGSYYRYKLKSLQTPKDFQRIRQELADQKERWLPHFRGRLCAILDWLDARLGPEYEDSLARPNLARIPFWKAAPWYWSAHAFGVHLTLAVAYPVLLLLLFWTVSGIDTSGINVLPDNMVSWQRYVALIAVIVTAHSFYHSVEDLPSLIVAFSVAFAVAVAFAGAGPIAIAFAFVVAFAGAGPIAVIFAFAVAFAFAAVGSFSGLFAVAVAFTVGFAVIVGFAVAVASAATYFSDCLYVKKKREKNELLDMAFFIIFSFVAIAFGFGIQEVATRQLSVYLLTFFALIPIINAIYDWLSLGLTRYLLRRSLDEERYLFLYSFLDLVAAIVFLVALSVTIVAAIAGLNAIAFTDKPPVDLAGILRMLRSDPGNPALWWIYAMIFSTLLPTFFHAGVALISLPMLRFMPGWRRRVARKMQEPGDSHEAVVKAALYLTLEKVWMVSTAVLALGALTGLLLWAVPGFARLLLFLCEETARLLGTDITPGPIAPFIRWS